MEAHNHVNHPKLRPAVVSDGTASKGCVGPAIGLVDIGVSEGAYLFRVALPGIRKDQSKVSNCYFIFPAN